MSSLPRRPLSQPGLGQGEARRLELAYMEAGAQELGSLCFPRELDRKYKNQDLIWCHIPCQHCRSWHNSLHDNADFNAGELKLTPTRPGYSPELTLPNPVVTTQSWLS